MIRCGDKGSQDNVVEGVDACKSFLFASPNMCVPDVDTQSELWLNELSGPDIHKMAQYESWWHWVSLGYILCNGYEALSSVRMMHDLDENSHYYL